MNRIMAVWLLIYISYNQFNEILLWFDNTFRRLMNLVIYTSLWWKLLYLMYKVCCRQLIFLWGGINVFLWSWLWVVIDNSLVCSTVVVLVNLRGEHKSLLDVWLWVGRSRRWLIKLHTVNNIQFLTPSLSMMTVALDLDNPEGTYLLKN